jgi:hypothetical protein
MNWGLGGSKSQAECFGEGINLLPLPGFKLQIVQPVANILTTLSWLLVISDGYVFCIKNIYAGWSIFIMSLSSAAVTEILLHRRPVCAGNLDYLFPTVQYSAQEHDKQFSLCRTSKCTTKLHLKVIN